MKPKIPILFKNQDNENGWPEKGLGFQILSYEAAQKIFEKWIEQNAKVVYGESGYFWNNKQVSRDTHQAYLICIEEVGKKECDHKNTLLIEFWDKRTNKITEKPTGYKCADCGKKLKSIWAVDE